VVSLPFSRPTSADQSSLDQGERSPSRPEEDEVRGGTVKEESGDKEEEKVHIAVGDLIDISSDPGELNV